MRAKASWRWMAPLTSAALHGAALVALASPWSRPLPRAEPSVLMVEMVRLAPSVAVSPATSVPATSPVAARPVKLAKPRPKAATPTPSPAIDTSPAPQGELGPSSETVATDHFPGSGDTETGRRAVPVATAPSYSLGSAHTPAPDYPWSARRRGIEGRVVVRLHVGADGTPFRVELLHSSGDSTLDRAALQTLRQWRLHPATSLGQAVDGQVVVPISFKLT